MAPIAGRDLAVTFRGALTVVKWAAGAVTPSNAPPPGTKALGGEGGGRGNRTRGLLQLLNREENRVQFLLDPDQTTGVFIARIAMQKPGDRPAERPAQLSHL